MQKSSALIMKMGIRYLRYRALVAKIKKTKNQQWLEKIATTDPDMDLRRAAVEKTEDQELLKKIYQDKKEYYYVRSAAIAGIRDPGVLREIVIKDRTIRGADAEDNESLGFRAWRCLSERKELDEGFAVEVAFDENVPCPIRCAAVKTIRDQEMLMKLSLSRNHEVSKMAIGQITEEYYLNRIVMISGDPCVQDEAIRRLVILGAHLCKKARTILAIQNSAEEGFGSDDCMPGDGAPAIPKKEYEGVRKTGSTIVFGTYPQTSPGTDKTPIEWVLLDFDEANHRALLLSKYGLAAKPYNTEKGKMVTWEKCTLRAWLNSEFLNEAFSAEERSAILITELDNSLNQGVAAFDTDGGRNTEDRIFLLSFAEAKRYLKVNYVDNNNNIFCVVPTSYAIAQGARTKGNDESEDSNLAWWWLRSPGITQYQAAALNGITLSDEEVCNGSCVVRPAFWLNLG